MARRYEWVRLADRRRPDDGSKLATTMACVSGLPDSLLDHAVASAKLDANAEHCDRHDVLFGPVMSKLVQLLRISMELPITNHERVGGGGVGEFRGIQPRPLGE